MSEIRVGTCSWTDKTLIDSKAFYPSSTRSAEQRLRFYASHFPVVEVDSSYYALPSERNSLLWVERTPEDFVFDFKAFGMLTQHPVEVRALPAEIKHLLGDSRSAKRAYARDVSERALEMVWALFEAALRPLAQAGKLGVVLFQFPHWFRKNKQTCDYLREVAERFPYRTAVEFRGGAWMEEGRSESTLELLEQLGLTYVVVDEPQGFGSSTPPLIAATSNELAMIRMHGHNSDNWEKQGISAAERFNYLYSEDELRDWIAPARELAGQSRQVHVLFNNCYADNGIRNARQMAKLLS